jgi:tRNA threonylcarbamoyladenosine biosynthesis protein TsaE
MSDPSHVEVSHAALELTTTDVEETIAFGRALGALLRCGDLVVLYGDLGAGKTHLAKGIVAGLGSDDLVNSPTFVLINQYRAGAQHGYAPIYHADLYRVDEPGELEGIGIEEAWAGEGFCLIEWPERAGAALPFDRLAIELREIGATARTVRLTAYGARYSELLAALDSRLRAAR